MPQLSRWFVRAALIHLLIGFGIGALLLVLEAASSGAPRAPWLSLHVEVLLQGWTGNLILGVAYWILPRFLEGPPRRRETAAYASFFSINTGIWVTGLAPSLSASGLPQIVGRLLEVSAALLFLVHAWPRIRKGLS